MASHVPPLSLNSISNSSPSISDILELAKGEEEFPAFIHSRENFKSKLKAKLSDVPADLGAEPIVTEGDRPIITGDLSLESVAVIHAMRALKNGEERSRGDSLKIYRFLVDQPFFLDLDRRKIEMISERVGYVYYRAGSQIIRQGDIGDYFYMMIHGIADVSVNGFGWVDNFHAPASFGELAMTSDEARQANIHAKTDCHLVRLSRQDFNEIIKDYKERQQEDVYEFLSKQPMFAKWSRNRFFRIVPRIQVKNMRVGDKLIVQGKAPFAVYILKKGGLRMEHTTETPSEQRWPSSEESAELALHHAERTGIKKSARITVRITEPGSSGEAEQGGKAGEISTNPGTAGANESSGESGLQATSPAMSRARELGSKVRETGLDYLPIPLRKYRSEDDENVPGSQVEAKQNNSVLSPRKPWGSPIPSPRQRGWGAGSPGGTLAYSTTSASTLAGSPRPGPPPAPVIDQDGVFLDSSRVLPTAVLFDRKVTTTIVGHVEPGKVFGLGEALGFKPFPFTLVCDTPGTSVLYFSKKYLSSIKPDELKYGAPPNPLLATILSEGAAFHVIKNLNSNGLILDNKHKHRVARELVAEAALALEVAKNPKLKTSMLSVKHSTKKVADSVASKDPAVLVSLLPMGSDEVAKIMWAMVSNLAEEVYSFRHGKVGEASPRTPAPSKDPRAPVTPSSGPMAFNRSRISGSLFAKASSTSQGDEPPPSITIPRQ